MISAVRRAGLHGWENGSTINSNQGSSLKIETWGAFIIALFLSLGSHGLTAFG